MNTRTEVVTGGTVTFQGSDQMIALAEQWLLHYFQVMGPKTPGQLEDDFCGEPSALEMGLVFQGRWRDSPFYPALAHLIDRGDIHWWTDDAGSVWYALAPAPHDRPTP